jgi:hypothetical protein
VARRHCLTWPSTVTRRALRTARRGASSVPKGPQPLSTMIKGRQTAPTGGGGGAATIVLPRISFIALGLTLLEDEQKFKTRGCVGAHKTPVSYTNMSSNCIK